MDGWFARSVRGVFTLACGLVAATSACESKVEDRTPEEPSDFWALPPLDPRIPMGGGSRPTTGGGFGSGVGDPPQASENYVFVPNPEGRSVVVIDSRELTIRSIETGNAPSYLRTIPGSDAALVLNVGTGDASVVRVASDGTLSTTRLAVVKGANAIEIAPDGRHAVVFFDADKGIAGNDFGDFQSVSVVSLQPGAESSATLSVGFKPERVAYQRDSLRAFVVTEQGLSVLNFADIEAMGSGIAPALSFGSQQVVREEIAFSADGHYAVAPMPFSAELRLLDLDSGLETVRNLQALFPSEPDTFAKPYFASLDYDSERSYLYAVEAQFRSVVRIPIPSGLTGEGVILRQTVPHDVTRVSHMPGSDLVLSYRPDSGVSKLSVIDFSRVRSVPSAGAGGAGGAGGMAGEGGDSGDGAAMPGLQTHELRKGVQAVYPSPDGTTAIISHDRQFGDPNEEGIPLELRILRSSGHTLLHPENGELKLERTAADIDDVVFSGDGKFAFLLINEPSLRYPVAGQFSVREVHRIDLARFLTNPIILLDSAPIAGAAVPGQTRVFVSQDHPDGRLTFIDWLTSDVQTVTGFELNSRIRN